MKGAISPLPFIWNKNCST